MPAQIDFDPSVDYYKILGVTDKASADEIKKAYRKLAKANHPDSTGGDKVKEKRFKEISNAYDVLGDAKKKKQYDQIRAGGFRPDMGGGGVYGTAGDYTRYIRDVAAPIDEEARRTGAFLSVMTYQAADTTVPWTHMRIFILRDSAQLAGLSAALAAAGVALQPDSVKRRQQSEYSATLRDAVGSTVVDIVR